MYYVLLVGKDFDNKDFSERDKLRNQLVDKLIKNGIKFLEYHWIWDETNRVQLLVGSYHDLLDAKDWIEFLKKCGFTIRIVEKIP